MISKPPADTASILYEDECFIILQRYLEQVVSDYVNPKLRFSRLTAEREHFETARDFLHGETAILWGDIYQSLEDFLGIFDIDPNYFTAEVEKLAVRVLEEHMSSKLRRRRKSPRAYLIGPIEYSPDHGLGWRQKLAEELKKLGIQAVLPNDYTSSVIANEFTFQQLKKVDIAAYREKMRQIIDIDLGLVEQADLIICKYNGEKISGTAAEATYAYMRSIPTYLITDQPLESIPGWFLATFDYYLKDEIELIIHLEAEYGKEK